MGYPCCDPRLPKIQRMNVYRRQRLQTHHRLSDPQRMDVAVINVQLMQPLMGTRPGRPTLQSSHLWQDPGMKEARRSRTGREKTRCEIREELRPDEKKRGGEGELAQGIGISAPYDPPTARKRHLRCTRAKMMQAAWWGEPDWWPGLHES